MLLLFSMADLRFRILRRIIVGIDLDHRLTK